MKSTANLIIISIFAGLLFSACTVGPPAASLAAMPEMPVVRQTSAQPLSAAGSYRLTGQYLGERFDLEWQI